MGVLAPLAFLLTRPGKVADGVRLWFGNGAGLTSDQTGDAYLLWDGTRLTLAPLANGTPFRVGLPGATLNVTQTGDLTLTGTTTLTGNASVSGTLALATAGALTGYRVAVVDKGTNYSPSAAESGTVFTASGAVTFTLPAVAGNSGVVFDFMQTANNNLVISAPAGTLVSTNNAGLTTATFSTAGELIGSACRVVCTGSKWLLFVMVPEAHTVTLA